MTPGERVKGFIERIGPLKLLPVRCNYCDGLPTEHTETCPETAMHRLAAENELLRAKCAARWIPVGEKLPELDSTKEFAKRGLSETVELWDRANNIWVGFYDAKQARWWIYQGHEDDAPLGGIYVVTHWRKIEGPKNALAACEEEKHGKTTD